MSLPGPVPPALTLPPGRSFPGLPPGDVGVPGPVGGPEEPLGGVLSGVFSGVGDGFDPLDGLWVGVAVVAGVGAWPGDPGVGGAAVGETSTDGVAVGEAATDGVSVAGAVIGGVSVAGAVIAGVAVGGTVVGSPIVGVSVAGPHAA